MTPTNVARGSGRDGEALLTRGVLGMLARTQGLCVSIFAPMHTSGRDTRENSIRFKNRVSDADRQLRAAGLSEEEAESLLEPARNLVGDRAFWQHQSEGLALFLAPGEQHLFRLPRTPPNLTVVGKHFHLKPLLPSLMGDARFFILALSLGTARLFEATRDRVRELDLAGIAGVPTSFEEALRFDVVEKHLGSHDVSPGQSGSETRFHGQGAGDDERNSKILDYFQQLSKGVRQLVDDERTPVVFAGVEDLVPIYRKANRYSQLMEQFVRGNPDALTAEELLERAWPIVEAHVAAARDDAIERFEGASRERSSTALEQIVVAAADGRVDTLLVALDTQRWGRFDREARSVRFDDEATADNEGLLNLAVIFTVLHGGDAFALGRESMPDSAHVAATYRYGGGGA